VHLKPSIYTTSHLPSFIHLYPENGRGMFFKSLVPNYQVRRCHDRKHDANIHCPNEQVSEAVMMLPDIRELPSSNLGQDTGYLE
jgi:hypothetical protein